MPVLRCSLQHTLEACVCVSVIRSSRMFLQLCVCFSCLQTCSVTPLSKAGESVTLPNAEAAEAGVYGTTQHMYRLLAGLMAAAESGGP